MSWKIAYSSKVVVAHPARNSFDQLSKKAKRVVSGYIELKQAGFKNHFLTVFWHGLVLLKPPIKAASIIFKKKDLSVWTKIRIYSLDYLIKLVQLFEFIQIQCGGKSYR